MNTRKHLNLNVVIMAGMLGFFALIAFSIAAHATVRGEAPGAVIVAEPVPPTERSKPEPLLDVPLRDPSVCRGPDGTYYMTGTLSFKDEGKDFDNNAGIRLWKSKDLKNWEDLGLVWEPAKESRNRAFQWVIRPTSIMDRMDRPRRNSAITAPEIHYLRGTYWLTFSRNHYGTGLLKSETGKPEGPYVAPGKTSMITHWGSDPSLFEDDPPSPDGSGAASAGAVYWLWAGPQVFIARMKDDMTGLAEAPRALTCKETASLRGTKEPSPQSDYLGRGGPFMYKVNGVYHLAASDIGMKHATTVGTVFVAPSKESVYGPYAEKTVLIPHAGQTTIFQDNDGHWLATYGGRDRYSVFKDRAGIVPLEWIQGFRAAYNQPGIGVGRIYEGGPLMVMNRTKVFTERGPWTKVRPLLPVHDPRIKENDDTFLKLWDTNMIQAPDGYFYMTGSQNGKDYIRKLRVWRSRDLHNWEDIVVHTFDDEPHLPDSRKNLELPMNDLGNCYMDCKISWLTQQKTFAVSYTIYLITGGPKAAPHITGRDRGNFSGVIVSESGTIRGPWRRHDTAQHSAVYFELENGRTAVLGGVNGGRILKPGYWDHRIAKGEQSITKQYEEVRTGLLNPPDTFGSYVEDSGTQFLRMGDQWVMMPCTINGGLFGYPSEFQAYSTAFLTADEIMGPWSKWEPGVPYGGHASIFQGLDKHWYGLVWSFRPIKVTYGGSPILVRLQVQFSEDGRLERMDIDPDWSVEDYVVPEWVK